MVKKKKRVIDILGADFWKTKRKSIKPLASKPLSPTSISAGKMTADTASFFFACYFFFSFFFCGSRSWLVRIPRVVHKKKLRAQTYRGRGVTSGSKSVRSRRASPFRRASKPKVTCSGRHPLAILMVTAVYRS